MAAGEEEFVKKRIYLPLERGRDIAVRNLFRKVFLAGGLDSSSNNNNTAAAAAPVRRTRVPVHEFLAAMRLSTRNEEEEYGELGRGGKAMIDRDEVECVLANLIYKVFSPLRYLHFDNFTC
jgi:hypothetical protein